MGWVFGDGLLTLHSVGAIFATAFGFGIGFDSMTQMWWDHHNRGVRIGRPGAVGMY